ncbi:hypothetical protein [Algibacter sp.]|uniref:hypothetical protein n=1 Tax=Algibacter sp. TaxID=1872428 RepID=UPI003C7875F1
MITISKRLKTISICIIALLLIPLISMQFTDEVNWTLGDFIAAAILLFGAGISMEFFLKKFTKTSHRIIIISIIIVLLVLLWAELAVGIFGSPLAGS